jgi:AraC-like DNA-binding protein/quercetin dioxygenase-like cupin family protein
LAVEGWQSDKGRDMSMPVKDMFLNRFPIESVSCRYYDGAPKMGVPAHNTGWRTIPADVIVTSYKGDYTCELYNGETFTVRNGQAVFVPADVRHKMICKNENTINYIHIRFMIFGVIDILSLFSIPNVFGDEKGRIISQNIEQLNTNRFSSDESYRSGSITDQRDAAYSLLQAIVSCSAMNGGAPKMLSNISKIYPVLDYIQNNMECIASRRELSDIINISETRFHYIFKDITGHSPIAYLKSVRFKKSQMLLLTTGLTVDSISRQVGYEDAFNFSKQFKKQFGESPSEYRKKHRIS